MRGSKGSKGVRRSMRPAGLLGGLGAIAVLLAAPVAASAATTVGQTPPVAGAQGAGLSMLPTLCPKGVNLAQSKTGTASATSPTYAVPAGVITSWSHRGATLASGEAGKGKLIVWRKVTDNSFLVVGKSGIESFKPNALTTHSTQITVQAGDLLGLRTEADGVACFFSNFNQQSSPGDEVRFQSGLTAQSPDGAKDPDVGSTQSFPSPAPPSTGQGVRVNVSAKVEPDADADGFGDETQDACPTDATIQGACPAPPQEPLPAPDLTPPELALSGKGSQGLGRAVKVAASCASEDCQVLASGRLVARTPKKGGGKKPKRIRRFRLTEAAASLAAGETRVLSLRVSKPARKAAQEALDAGGTVRAFVTVHAADTAGNGTSTRRAVWVR